MKGLQATWSGPMFSWRSDGKRSMAGTTGISKLIRLTLSFDVCSFGKMMQWQYDMLTCSTIATSTGTSNSPLKLHLLEWST